MSVEATSDISLMQPDLPPDEFSLLSNDLVKMTEMLLDLQKKTSDLQGQQADLKGRVASLQTQVCDLQFANLQLDLKEQLQKAILAYNLQAAAIRADFVAKASFAGIGFSFMTGNVPAIALFTLSGMYHYSRANSSRELLQEESDRVADLCNSLGESFPPLGMNWIDPDSKFGLVLQRRPWK